MLFDTHVHFDMLSGTDNSEEYISAAIQRALNAGVTRMLAVGSSSSANCIAVRTATNHPEIIRAAAALDRDQQPDDNAIRELERTLSVPEIAAVGETGLDFHYNTPDNPTPRALFRRMLELAREFTLPVIVHSRNADRAILEELTGHAAAWRGAADAIGVMHCFTGSSDFATRLVELGFHISFSGIITFKNAGALRETAAMIPDNRLLLETDTPFLAPEPLRGKSNEPAFLTHTAAMLARIRNQTPETVAGLTSANARRLFGM